MVQQSMSSLRFEIGDSGCRKGSVEKEDFFWVFRKVFERLVKYIELPLSVLSRRPGIVGRWPFILDFVRDGQVWTIRGLIKTWRLK